MCTILTISEVQALHIPLFGKVKIFRHQTVRHTLCSQKIGNIAFACFGMIYEGKVPLIEYHPYLCLSNSNLNSREFGVLDELFKVHDVSVMSIGELFRIKGLLNGGKWPVFLRFTSQKRKKLALL